jgi:uncharacterized protein YbcC (UPF0753/DUF2309 family)
MSLPLADILKLRTMVYIAGEPIAFFWPMRNFIHHNPLHGLEGLAFGDAVERGKTLFGARGFLKRHDYQRYLAEGTIDDAELCRGIRNFLASHDLPPGINWQRAFHCLLTRVADPIALPVEIATPACILAALRGEPIADIMVDQRTLTERMQAQLGGDRPLCEVIDAIYGTKISETLDDLLIKTCLDFFDEGQSTMAMPGREHGFFRAWSRISRHNLKMFLRGLQIDRVLQGIETPEAMIARAMRIQGVPEEYWVGNFTRELARLHGWAGFIRWRQNARNYYWAQQYPADLVDFLAVREALVLALLHEEHRPGMPATVPELATMLEQRPHEVFLRLQSHSGTMLPEMAHRIHDTILRGKTPDIARMFDRYTTLLQVDEAHRSAAAVKIWGDAADITPALQSLEPAAFGSLLTALRKFEAQEGMIWLRAMEGHAIDRFARGIDIAAPKQRAKRPFAQALFCIDTRSERIRRHFEAIGDYQTFGIAGFFGVPISLLELGKGHEAHLCPAIVTPRNLVLEMHVTAPMDETVAGVLAEALHELKNSILTPFATVEAIGLLFGFDLIGKTMAPVAYHRWRGKLFSDPPPTRLLLDKLSREQADSILRAVQRELIVKAIQHERGLPTERISDEIVRDLREVALRRLEPCETLAVALGLSLSGLEAFVERLRRAYRINRQFSRIQLERLGRIGFSLTEQAHFVGQALRSIGLTEGFSRFVLLVGHASVSDNNPYESALDCGACGGASGSHNARVLAQMANKVDVRRRLREQGIDIPEDVVFLGALHNTVTDDITLTDPELIPPAHLLYLDRLHKGLIAASRLCAQERIATLLPDNAKRPGTGAARRIALRNAVDWSQVRPEWGLSRNTYFVIGRRHLTQKLELDGRAFLHSYDWRIDPKRRLLESIITGPLVVGQWINMEHYFSAVDNETYGSGSKVYHNVAGRFGVMTGNLSDLRTGLPAQTVLRDGRPYHDPLRLITVIEAPVAHARAAVEGVVTVRRLVQNGWIRLLIVDSENGLLSLYIEGGEWRDQRLDTATLQPITTGERITA